MGGRLGSLQGEDDSDGYGSEEKQKGQKLWRTEGHERERESFGVCVGVLESAGERRKLCK